MNWFECLTPKSTKHVCGLMGICSVDSALHAKKADVVNHIRTMWFGWMGYPLKMLLCCFFFFVKTPHHTWAHRCWNALTNARGYPTKKSRFKRTLDARWAIIVHVIKYVVQVSVMTVGGIFASFHSISARSPYSPQNENRGADTKILSQSHAPKLFSRRRDV
jgi:hypothetical protein